MTLKKEKQEEIIKWFMCCDYQYNPENSVWLHTCRILKDDIMSLPKFKTEKEASVYLHKIFYQYLDQANLPVPEMGIGRDGEQILVRDKKTSSTKWSSWAITFKGVRYVGDIAKISYHIGGAAIFDKNGLAHPRIQLLEQVKNHI